MNSLKLLAENLRKNRQKRKITKKEMSKVTDIPYIF